MEYTNIKASEVLPDFLDQADIKSSSKATYERVLRLFFRWLSKNKLAFDKVSRGDIIRWKGDFGAQHKPKTLNLYLSIVKKFYAWLGESGYYSDVARGIRMGKISYGYYRFPLEIEQCKALLASIDTTNDTGKRDHALINLMLITGLRRIEINRLDVGDLIMVNNRHTLKIQRKGHAGKDQYKPISVELFDELQDMICARKEIMDSDPLFITHNKCHKGQRLSVSDISSIAKKYLNKIGLTNAMYTCHSLRHTTAVLLLKSGCDLYYVQQYMGHSSPATTQLYTKIFSDILRDDSKGIEILQKSFKN